MANATLVERMMANNSDFQEVKVGSGIGWRPANRDVGNELCNFFNRRVRSYKEILIANSHKNAVTIGGETYPIEELARFLHQDLDALKKSGAKRKRTIEDWLRSRHLPTRNIEKFAVRLEEYINTNKNTGTRIVFPLSANVTRWFPWPSKRKDVYWGYADKNTESYGGLYCPTMLEPTLEPDILHLGEGEKDALGLALYGFLAMGVPGNRALTVERAEWLVGWIKARNEAGKPITRIRLCFDFDKAGDEGTVEAAKHLAQLNIKVEYLVWPSHLRNKYDIGDFIADQGEVFAQSLIRSDWRDYYEEVAKNPTRRELISKEIIRETDAYYLSESDDNKEALTTFTLKFKRQFRGAEGIWYSLVANHAGETSDHFEVPGDKLTKPQMFQDILATNVGSEFIVFDSCKPDHLKRIVDYEVRKPDCLKTIRRTGYGYHEDLDIYAFPNMVISDGQVILADEDGLIELNGKKYIFHTYEDAFDSRPIYGNSKFAWFDDIATEDEVCMYAIELQKHFAALVGKQQEYAGLMALSWMLSTFLSDVPYNHKYGMHDRSFPLLMVHGMQQSGKTTLIRLLHHLISLDISEGTKTTKAGFERNASALKNIPYWMDEVKLHGDFADTLKIAYSRGSVTKGALNLTRNFHMQASFILTGEQSIPELENRSISISYPSPEDRTSFNEKAFDHLQDMIQQSQHVGLYIMTKRTSDPSYVEDYVKEYHRVYDWLKFNIHELPRRQRHNFAITLAGLKLLPDTTDLVDGWLKDFEGLAYWLKQFAWASIGRTMADDVLELALQLFIGQPGCFIFKKIKDGKEIYFVENPKLIRILSGISSYEIGKLKAKLAAEPYCINGGAPVTERLPRADIYGWQNKGKGSPVSALAFDGSHARCPALLKAYCYEYDERDRRWFREGEEIGAD